MLCGALCGCLGFSPCDDKVPGYCLEMSDSHLWRCSAVREQWDLPVPSAAAWASLRVTTSSLAIASRHLTRTCGGAVLCGNNGEACWSKYGSYPLHRPYCHEMALRILLASLEAHANRHKRYIVPVRFQTLMD